MDREPCPWRIVDDTGGAFMLGITFGGIFYIVKGARGAPVGSRLHGALSCIQARGPVLGGNFAVWGGLFAICDCSLVAMRHKEDPWNAIISGAATGSLLAIRAGPKNAAKNAIMGGVVLAVIEGVGIAVSQMFSNLSPPGQELPGGERESGSSGGPRQPALAPPIAMPSFGNQSSHLEPAPADVLTGSGFDTDSEYIDPMAAEDQLATTGEFSRKEEKNKGFFGRLFG